MKYAVPFPDRSTLHELIEQQFAGSGSATALICDDASMTVEELNARSNQLARRLRDAGVARDTVVGIVAERSFSMMIGLLGILKAGGAYLPLSPENPPDRTSYMLNNAAVKVLLSQNNTSNGIPFSETVINLDDARIYTGPDDNLDIVNKPDDLAYVIYTSGSTGKPKGVMIEHRAIVNRLHWMQSAYPIGPTDVVLQKTPYFFDVSVWELFWWALYGAKLCLLRPRGEKAPMAIAEAIRKHHVTVMHFVPSMLKAFLEYLDGKSSAFVQGLASLRQIFASGEALSPTDVRKFNDVLGHVTGARLTNLYGPTEATVDVTYFDCPSDNDFERIPIGKPIDNIQLSIITNGRAAAIGETGELCIAGVGLARGYLNDPALTNEKFTESPIQPGQRIYRTGDVARWLPDGNVEYLGREDHQVKIRGLRIELGEIESSIRDFPDVQDCIAVTRKYSDTVVLIVAYIIARRPFAIDALKAHLQKGLPDYMIPNHFQFIEEIPLTPSGKADRKALPEAVLHAR
jgi:D-alanine--poly(phosphoribitol) ligase subunit 1